MNLHPIARLAAACAFAISAVSAHAETAAAGAGTPTAVAGAATDPLFDALGGKPGIAFLVDDFVPRLAADPKIGAFFKDTNLRELKKQLADQFCAVSGGGCVYEGDDMKRAHANMKIAKADFNRLVEILQVSMDARSIPFADQNRLLARLAPMHRDIVNVP
jgi:hemoglobin